MSLRLRCGLLLLVVVAQLAAVGQMIYARETLLRKGELFLFKTAPVDPVDPFRGRYVALRLEADSAPLGGWRPQRNDRVYARVDKDAQGFAMLTQILPEPPPDGAYLKLRVISIKDNRARLDLPFDRYYARETLAPEIERAYRRNSRQGKQQAWVRLRVHRGQAAIEELVIDGLPVADYLRREAQRTP